MSSKKAQQKASSVNADEIGRFAALASRWWDEAGPMRPLHRMKPARTRYIEGQALKAFGKGLKGLSILDVGCGAGLMSEALAQSGADVLGLDASAELIEAARDHGKAVKNLTYAQGAVEEIAGKKTFDIVMALEVAEHVNDPAAFIKSCAACVKKNGILILSTLNRTPQSFATAIVGAEYLLRIIPRGTHDWRKFIKPSELGGMVKEAGLGVGDITGLALNPFNQSFSLDPANVSVDYFLTASRA